MDKLLKAIKAVLKPVLDPVVAAAKIPVNIAKGNFGHILQEPLVYGALILTAANTATDHTTWGYVAAGVMALLRALVTPASQAENA